MSEHKCERCGYDDADPEVRVPDTFADRYLALCGYCCDLLIRIENRRLITD